MGMALTRPVARFGQRNKTICNLPAMESFARLLALNSNPFDLKLLFGIVPATSNSSCEYIFISTFSFGSSISSIENPSDLNSSIGSAKASRSDVLPLAFSPTKTFSPEPSFDPSVFYGLNSRLGQFKSTWIGCTEAAI
jgi:hypothetical protein